MAKVFIADDADFIRIQLRGILESAGYVVVEAADGYEGIEVLKANKDVRLIISDLNMPRMNGLMMCEAVKKDQELKHIPIVMLTTEASPELKLKGKEIGILAWAIKPFKGEDLLAVAAKMVK